jgi:hypothetical protein
MVKIQQVEAPVQIRFGKLCQQQGKKQCMIYFRRFWKELVYAGVQVYFGSDHVVICWNDQFMVVTEKNVPFHAGYGGTDYIYSWKAYRLFDQCLKISEGCLHPLQDQIVEPMVFGDMVVSTAMSSSSCGVSSRQRCTTQRTMSWP